MKKRTANRIHWKSNSSLSAIAAAILLTAVAVLSSSVPSLGNVLLVCSTGPGLLLAISAIYWARREKPGFQPGGAIVILLGYGALACGSLPEAPEPIRLDALANFHMDQPYEDIAKVIGNGDWLSDEENFTVAYPAEGGQVLWLVFEDGIHLTEVRLSERSNAEVGPVIQTAIP